MDGMIALLLCTAAGIFVGWELHRFMAKRKPIEVQKVSEKPQEAISDPNTVELSPAARREILAHERSLKARAFVPGVEPHMHRFHEGLCLFPGCPETIPFHEHSWEPISGQGAMFCQTCHEVRTT